MRQLPYRTCTFTCTFAFTLAFAFAQEAPLPDGDALVRELVGKQRHREALLDQYTYDVTEVRETLDGKGRATERTSRTWEVFHVAGRPVRTLVAKDERPLSAAERQREDAKTREQVAAIRAGRVATEQADVRLSEVLSQFRFRSASREDVEGRPAIVLEILPRPDPPPVMGDRLLRVLGGRLWVDEADREVVRAELKNRAPVGFGLKARLNALDLTFAFRKVDGAVWLPLKVVAHGSARVLLVKRVERRTSVSYGNWRRFATDVTEEPADKPVVP